MKTELKERIRNGYETNSPFTVGRLVGNLIYHNVGVEYPQDYTFEEYWALVVGDEIHTGEFENGNEIFEFMEEED